MLWRSGHPDRLDDAGWAELGETGITTVIDLRNEDERSRAGGARGGIRVIHCPLEAVDDPEYSRRWDRNWATPDFYAWGRMRWPALWSAALGAIAEAPGGVLIHCVGGRDRTGMVTAALLQTAGVRREYILGDYVRGIRERSRRDIDGYIDEYRDALNRLLDGLAPERELKRAAARLL